MVWTRWRGVLGGSAATLLLTASATIALAQTATLTPPTTLILPYIPPPIVILPAQPAATNADSGKPDPAHPAKQTAAAKSKAPATKLAATPKKPASAKNIAVAAKKPATPTKTAAATPKLMPASYTVTTTRDNVTYTSTRVVPVTLKTAAATPAMPPTVDTTPASLTPPAASTLPPPATTTPAISASLTEPAATTSPPATTLTAIPASLTLAAEPAPRVEKATPAKPAPPPAVTTAPPPSGGAATAFVSNFLKDAFRIAKSDGKTSFQRRAELASLFASKMDMKFIAGYTTADELIGATTDMQQRFRAILVNYLVETYYPRLELASDPSVTVDVTPAQPFPDGSSVVWATFTKAGWGSQSIKWHLTVDAGSFKVVDIFSGGASLVQMERDTFQSVMRNGGIKELMAQLDARTKQLAAAAE
jgi:ABC-type transporter MlaC component